MPDHITKKILMVEDNEGDVELMKIAFSKSEHCQYDITIAHDGQEGVDYLKSIGDPSSDNWPDMILLDINMPRMNGIEFLNVIKENDALKSIPIIMLTSSESPSDVMEAYNKHVNSYLIKGNSMDQFIKIAASVEEFWFNHAKLPKQAGSVSPRQ